MKKSTIQRTVFLLSVAAVFCNIPAPTCAEERIVVKDLQGTEKFTVHDDGSVGVGTSTPTAVFDISPGTISGDSFKVNATDSNNSYQLKVMGHTGGTSHVQITTDQADSRLTLLAGDQNDQAPRFGAVGAQDSVTAVRGWALIDYGSYLYSLPDAEFKVRNIYYDGSSATFTDMLRFVGTSSVIFPNGNVGIGTSSPTHLIHLSGGAYSDGASWTNASSRELKENIQEVSASEAIKTVENLKPVSFNYKKGNQEQHVGFIAEDVPELVATSDRKGLDSMDIVAVLTKVIQEQQKMLQEQQKILLAHQEKIGELETALQFKKDKDLSLSQADVKQGITN